jgi:predicted alpha/beta-fold hydrolase
MKKVANGIYEKELLLIRDSVMAWSWQVATQDDDDLPALEDYDRNPTPPHQGMTVWMHSLTGGSAEHAYYVRLHV